MIRYRDFAPRQTRPAGFLALPQQSEIFDAAVAEANAWIEQAGVEVVTIETVVLPIRGTTGDFQSTWHQFVRVWYRSP